LTEQGAEFESVNYLEHPLTAQELKRLLRSAGLSPRDALRTKEAAYKSYVADKDLADDQLIEIMAAHPELIQRPIVVHGDKAVLARPVQKLSELDIK
jgi:arsenate reductase